MSHTVVSLRKHLKVIRRLWAISIQKSLTFRWQFITDTLDESVSVALSLLFFDIAYEHAPAIGGWSQHQAILLIGVFQIHSVIQNVFFMPSLYLISRTVFMGKLDGLLLRPVSTRLMLSIREIRPVGLLRLLPGFAVVGYALDALGHTPDLLDLLVAGALFFAGIAIVYAMWFASLTIEFWIEGLWSMEDLIPHLFYFGQYPDGIYSGVNRTLFLTILPVIAIANFPTHGLLGNWTLNMVLHAFGLAGVMMVLSHLQWRRALRRYSSAGS